jgi:hypothetical protein
MVSSELKSFHHFPESVCIPLLRLQTQSPRVPLMIQITMPRTINGAHNYMNDLTVQTVSNLVLVNFAQH